jgi:Leucine-rich repeat (LRR) protein
MRIADILPTELGLLTSLEELDLRENQLTGKIPSEIGVLTSLTFVDLSKVLYVYL